MQKLARYGLTPAGYDALLEEQHGGCALCGATDSGRNKDGSPRRLNVDHNHETGAVRGLLCRHCNILVGYLEKSDVALVRRAQDYIVEVLDAELID